MFSPIRFSCLLASVLLTAGLAQPAAISINGTCEMGTCSSPDALNQGGTTSGTFSYIYTFSSDGDRYRISGNYSASYSAGTSISFGVLATFLGNASNSTSSADLLSVDLLQSYNYIGNPDGTYSVTTTLTQGGNGPGSYTESQLSYDGQGLGLLGPYYGPGSQVFTASKTLSALTEPLTADYNFTFYFAPGTAAAPEPAEVGMLALGLLASLVPVLRRRDKPAARVIS